MTDQKTIDKLKLPNVFILLLIIILSCALLIFINYFTIKILSASRAYVNGESFYSKGQKDGARHLITYLYTQDEKQWESFKEELKVPQGDGAARMALLNNEDTAVIKKGFRAGRNNEKDLDELIWLFQNFKSVPFLAKAINEWKMGDDLINQLSVIGNQVHQTVSTSNLKLEDRLKIHLQISDLSERLTINERNFLNTLGDGTRKIKDYLIYTNIFFILIIISSVGTYYSMMVYRLVNSKIEVEVKNENLIIANRELDKFVYSASHDLRSPITSLKGLIEIAQMEEDLNEIKVYLALMYQSLSKQDQFISDIIDYSKNKRKEVVIEPVSLKNLIEESIEQLQHIKNANKINIDKEILTDAIYSDNLRLKITINNLLSNAIKYADEGKQEMCIRIKTYSSGGNHIIEIADNGIGIKDEFQSHVFEMFFVTNNNKGSGLGLYIVKEAIENINGTIEVHSESNIGSTFTVTIPKRYET
ncbi:sensor histidine kinase [Flavobacterium humi]|uniref:histidine kinase n=1 Tax=Flavobacterium humi TaxID=2562683 RepID=A0A4Z0L2Z8_9FLAO|nr:HAMP domain-containing sensor histidine kinase [Flavobacterium humi]TGD56704.1 HAMP domain-containing histidine kinase [Flavobacterium humi]